MQLKHKQPYTEKQIEYVRILMDKHDIREYEIFNSSWAKKNLNAEDNGLERLSRNEMSMLIEALKEGWI